MSVRFSHDHGCWIYTCIFGCLGIDYEGEQEAIDAFVAHVCAS